MKLTVAKVEKALRATAGNVSEAARKLGVSRSTVYRHIDDSPTLLTVLEDTREELVDIAESALRAKVINGDITAIIFTLKTQGKQRGYIERQELSHMGEDGGPIEIRMVDYRAGIVDDEEYGEDDEE